MANVSRVNGLRPVRFLSGASYNGQANLYFIPSGDGTATFVGDMVKQDGTGDTAAAGGLALGIPSVIQCAATNASTGVVIGFVVDPTNLNITGSYRAASTGRYCLVADDPNIIFEIQTSNGTLAVADVGLNASIAVAAGSTTTGTSGMTLDVGTKATTAALELKIMSFSQRVDNDPASANAKVHVKINNHQKAASTGTAGV